MPNNKSPEGSAEVLAALKAQLTELQPQLLNLGQIVALKASLNRLKTLLTGLLPAGDTLLTDLGTVIAGISGVDGDLSSFGDALAKLYDIQQRLTNAQLAAAELDVAQSLLVGAISQVRQLLNYRPDIGAILDDLAAVKRLSGGPADATSFHDFNVLQIAFRDVWMHAFSDELRNAALELYYQAVTLYKDAGLTLPDTESLDDVESLKAFLTELGLVNASTTSSSSNPDGISAALEKLLEGTFLSGMAGRGGKGGTLSNVSPIPQQVSTVFGPAAVNFPLLTPQQQSFVLWQAQLASSTDATKEQKKAATDAGLQVLSSAQGAGGRLLKLVQDLSTMMSQPYAFDVFAPDSFNFGVMITYRQQWEPGDYQAGRLVSTIPLAPGETRKISVKRTVKESRVSKSIEKSASDRSRQFSSTQRAEADIMEKVSTATNFKTTAHGTFNFSFGSIDATTDFATNQAQDSTQTKKAFHEATLKAAEEYKQERSLEVDSTTSMETEETTSGEISNPNNELTVTYLYYELQRRYKIREFLYRVRPVVLVAQDVPSPDHIDEAWLIQNQWILARVLLDESLRPALVYLTTGMAGDEVSSEVLKVQWETQRQLVSKLENLTDAQIKTRDVMREALVGATTARDMLPEMPGALKVLSLGMDPTDPERHVLDAMRQAGESRLKYVEQALADAQEKLKDATTTFTQVTKEYVVALQNKYARHVAIDQLRLHVKQNIFYYMQAIWDHEPPDQRFFRLYKKKIPCLQLDANAQVSATVTGTSLTNMVAEFSMSAPSAGGNLANYEHDLVELADLDNPIGYKGNYIVFPMKDQCYLTTYMLSNFVDNYLGALDPDGSDDFDPQTFEQEWLATEPDSRERDALKQQLSAYIQEIRRSTDEIIVPTGQLFVEALPGTHALLEDFKLLHRAEDVRKVKAEVRHAELENLRLAARLVQGQHKPALLEDPDIDKKIVVDGKAAVLVDPGP
jgi:hypothetical protein